MFECSERRFQGEGSELRANGDRTGLQDFLEACRGAAVLVLGGDDTGVRHVLRGDEFVRARPPPPTA